MVSLIEQVRLSRNLMRGIGVTWRFRIAKSFSSNIQDGSHGGNLETLQTSPDSELLRQSDLIGKMATMAQCNIYHDQPNPGEQFLAHLGL